MIKLKKVKPMFTALITTAETYEDDEKLNGIITTKQKGTLKEYQRVIAVGSSVRDIKVGDLVSINPERFAVHKRDKNSLANDIEGGNPVLEYRFDIREVDGKPVLLLQDRDIEFIIEDYEPEEKPSPIIHPAKPEIIC